MRVSKVTKATGGPYASTIQLNDKKQQQETGFTNPAQSTNE
jgi:hypothetical protein